MLQLFRTKHTRNVVVSLFLPLSLSLSLTLSHSLFLFPCCHMSIVWAIQSKLLTLMSWAVRAANKFPYAWTGSRTGQDRTGPCSCHHMRQERMGIGIGIRQKRQQENYDQTFYLQLQPRYKSFYSLSFQSIRV